MKDPHYLPSVAGFISYWPMKQRHDVWLCEYLAVLAVFIGDRFQAVNNVDEILPWIKRVRHYFLFSGFFFSPFTE
jgi:hypothetical protein